MLTLLLLAACGRPPLGALPEHHLAFGGDFMVGRNLNYVLDDPARRDAFLGQLDLLRSADLALLNAEGVISSGGSLVAKGESAPHTWRARPGAIELLVNAGIDVVTQGNNHAGDYGPDAQRETIQRLRAAHLDAAGAGLNRADAKTPVYRKVGDTVVAIVGIDLTGVRAYGATKTEPGTLTANAEKQRNQDAIVAQLAAIAATAREHAHVVLLTPHWGPNWRTEPLPIIRTLARRLIEAGYDGILGHSAHSFQGVELFHGKPVIYDAGTLGLGYREDDAAHRGTLYDLTFTRAGIARVAVHPLALSPNVTQVARGPAADRILGEWEERTTALGTTFVSEGDTRVVACDPGWIEGPWATPDPPVRTAATVEAAPDHLWVDTLPENATPTDVRWANGVRLVGYHLLVPAVADEHAAQVVTLYLRAELPLGPDVELTIRATSGADTRVERHQPGDWALTADRWAPGRILVDRYLLSFRLDPAPGIRFDAGLSDPPVSSDLPVVGGLVTLGTVPLDPEAASLATLLAAP